MTAIRILEVQAHKLDLAEDELVVITLPESWAERMQPLMNSMRPFFDEFFGAKRWMVLFGDGSKITTAPCSTVENLHEHAGPQQEK